jgi:ligand-binding SRPBCC domain-containing protein
VTVFERTTRIDAPLATVFSFFSHHHNLQRITPPWARFRIVSSPGEQVREGDRIDYRFRVFGLPMRWTARITAYRENDFFVDFQERGPFRHWMHTHSFRADGDGTVMHDRVEYELPFGILGRLFGGLIVRRRLLTIFEYRGKQIRDAFR